MQERHERFQSVHAPHTPYFYVFFLYNKRGGNVSEVYLTMSHIIVFFLTKPSCDLTSVDCCMGMGVCWGGWGGWGGWWGWGWWGWSHSFRPEGWRRVFGPGRQGMRVPVLVSYRFCASNSGRYKAQSKLAVQTVRPHVTCHTSHVTRHATQPLPLNVPFQVSSPTPPPVLQRTLRPSLTVFV